MRAVHQHVEGGRGGGGWRDDEECSVRVVPLLTFALLVMEVCLTTVGVQSCVAVLSECNSTGYYWLWSG